MAVQFRFPKEIILQILDSLSQDEVLYFHDHLPEDDPLTAIFAKRLYRKVAVSIRYPWPCGDFYVTELKKDLEKLASQNFPTEHLEMGERDCRWVLKVVARHPSFFSQIPSIAFRGSREYFLAYASHCLIDNLTYVDMNEPEYADLMETFPSTLSEVTIQQVGEYIPLKSSNIKKMTNYEDDLRYLELPATLKELRCYYSLNLDVAKFPSGLKKFECDFAEELVNRDRLPEGLVELAIGGIVAPMKLPTTLKKLKFDRISASGKNIEFPSGLERLFLEFYDTEELSKVRFPTNLKNLTLSECFVVPSVVAKFPSSLVSLEYMCDEFDGSALPRGLKVLKVTTNQHSNQFPPTLEELDYLLRNERKQRLQFHFPSTLVHLAIRCTIQSILKMNRPNLESVELENCCGPVPSTVKTLIMTSQATDNPFMNFVAPSRVRKLALTHPLKKYPDSVLELKIEHFSPHDAPPFPKNARYLGLARGSNELRIKDLNIPPSIYLLGGNISDHELLKFYSSFPGLYIPSDIEESAKDILRRLHFGQRCWFKKGLDEAYFDLRSLLLKRLVQYN